MDPANTNPNLQRIRCPSCGRLNALHVRKCFACRTPLLVCLYVSGPSPAKSARQAASLCCGEDTALKKRLERTFRTGEGEVLGDLSLLEASEYQEQLRALGTTVDIRPAGTPKRDTRPWSTRPSAALVTLLTLALLLAGIVYGYKRITAPPADAGARWHSATVRPQRFVIAPLNRPSQTGATLTAPSEATSSRTDTDSTATMRTVTDTKATMRTDPDTMATMRTDTDSTATMRTVTDATSTSLRPPAPIQDQPLPDVLIEKVRKAVVRITVPEGVATGFFVTNHGLVVTTHHVVAGGKDIIVQSGSRRAKAKVVRTAPAWDLALLETKLRPPVVLGLADGVLATPTTPVFTVGSAEGLEGSVRQGRVSFLGRSIDAISVLELDLAATQGNSGAPVLDFSGRVVGIVNATLSASNRTSFAVLSNYLFEGADALLRDYVPTIPLEETFLSLQLQSLAEIGERALPGQALRSSQAFVTGSHYLAVVAEAGTDVEAHGESVLVDLWVRTRDGAVLMDEVVEAWTSRSEIRGEGQSAAIYFYFELTADEYERLEAAGDVLVEVRYDPFQLRRFLPLKAS